MSIFGDLFSSTTTNTPSPQAEGQLGEAFHNVQVASSQPYTPYTGQLVAPLNSGQQTAVGQLQGSYGAAQPYINTGANYLRQGAQGLGNVQNYLQAGSDAGSNATHYQQQGENDYLDAGDMSNRSVQALGAMQPYMDQANGALGQAGNSFGQATGALGQAGSSFGQATGALNQAGAYFGQAAGYADPVAFSGQALQPYMDPYTQSVIDTTMKQAAQNNQVQATNLAGGAIGSGAFGGDRNGIAQAALAGQQAMADNSTVAGLNSANYSQALGQFNQEQADRYQSAGIYTGLGQGSISQAAGYNTTGQGYLGQAAGYDTTGQGYLGQASGYTGQAQQQGQIAQQYGSLGSLAVSAGNGFNSLGQTSLGQGTLYNSLGSLQGTTASAQGNLGALSGYLGQTAQTEDIAAASAGLQGSTLQQQTQQQRDAANYGQFQQAQAYPFQTAGFEANVANGQAASLGSSSTVDGSPFSAIAGAGIGTLGILGATGAFGQNGYLSPPNLSNLGSGRAHGGAVSAPQKGLGAVPHRAMGGGVLAGGAPVQMMGLGALPGVSAPAAPSGPMGLGAFADRPRFQGGGGALGLAGLGGVNVMHPAHASMIVPHNVRRLSRPHFDNGGLISFDPNALMGQNDPTAPNPMFGAPVTGSRGLGAGGAGSAAGAGLGAPHQSASSTDGLGALTANPSAASSSPPPQAGLGDSASGDSSPSGQPSGLGFSKNASMGLIAAGLGMMGGTGSGVQNIGQGGLKGLQTYLGLQQQDRQNANTQQDFGLRKQTNQIDQQRADQTAQELIQNAAIAKSKLALETQQNATLAASAASENAARDQAAKINRYQTTMMPTGGFMVRDLTNPLAPPTFTQFAPAGSAPSPQAQPSAPSQSLPSPAQSPPAAPGNATPTSAPITGSAPVAPARTGAPSSALVPASGGSPAAKPPVPAQAWAAQQPDPNSPYSGNIEPPQVPVNYARMNPEYEKGVQSQGSEILKGAENAAQSAASTKLGLAEMQNDLAQIPPSGFLTAGPGQQQRAALASKANMILNGLGIDPKNQINPDAIGASEEVKKLSTRMGFDLARSLGGREPGMVVNMATQSVPTSDNSPIGAQRLMAGLNATAQRQIDYNNFAQKWSAKTAGDLTGMDNAFNKQNPPQSYADKAVVSTIPPGAVQALAANPKMAGMFEQKYGPGTAGIAFRTLNIRGGQ